MSMTLTKTVLQKYPNPIFLETGTFLGGGVELALECAFQKVISIEVEPKYYEIACGKFKDNPRVELLFGDSQLLFEKVVASLQSTATIWLDSHSHNNTVEISSPTTLISELEVLAKYPQLNHTILIDDIRVVRSGELWGESVGGINNVISKVMEINPEYKISFENNSIAMNDILVATI